MVRIRGLVFLVGLLATSAALTIPAWRTGSRITDPPCNKHNFTAAMSDGMVLRSTLYTLHNVTLSPARKLAITLQSFPYGTDFEKFIVNAWARHRC